MSRNAIRRPTGPAPRRDPPLWSLGVAEAGRRITAGALDPVDLVDAALARIAEVDGALHSFVHPMPDAARAAARAASAEIAAHGPRGPLHGIPFAVKDTYDLAGAPTRAGSRATSPAPAARDAALVATLRAAGAVPLGKLATWEYGTGDGGEYFDLPAPPARNPWDLARFTGGSSTGAGAAVAAGLAAFALGSDTTGSVRLPAAACGAAGMIPTAGRLSLAGVLPNCHSLDTPGPICRDAADLALVMGVLLGDPAAAAAAGAPVAGLRLAVVRDPGPGMPAPHPALAAAFEAGLATLAALGVRPIEARLQTSAAECLAITQMIGPAESASIHEAELRTRPDELGRALRAKLLAGSVVPAVDYLRAQRRRTEIAAEIDALLAEVDALVTFGALGLPPRLGEEPAMTAYTRETLLTPFSLSGHPALVQRTGFCDAGLPTHWQIVAPRGREATALALAAAFERASPAPARRPALPAAAAPPPPPLPEHTPPEATDDALRARAARAGLGALGPADLRRRAAFEVTLAAAAAAIAPPAAKSVPPAFGTQRPPDACAAPARAPAADRAAETPPETPPKTTAPPQGRPDDRFRPQEQDRETP